MRGIGGGMQSEVFAQMLADVLDTPFTPLCNPRFAGNFGLQTCIEIGLGYAKDFTVLDGVVHCGKTYQPSSNMQKRYDRLYSFFRESYISTEALYRKMNTDGQ